MGAVADIERERESAPSVVYEEGPRDDDSDRYAIYIAQVVTLSAAFESDRNDWGRKRLAETSLQGIGVTLMTLRDEEQITNDDRVGILDRREHRWLVNPWASGR